MSIFDRNDCDNYIARLNQLTPDSKPLWGKMDVTTMLAHCRPAYEDRRSSLSFFTKLWLRIVRKKTAVGDQPYGRNLKNPSSFKITSTKSFEQERDLLISKIDEACERGSEFYEGKKHSVFGVLSADEWSNFFFKHLDHHLRQFGV